MPPSQNKIPATPGTKGPSTTTNSKIDWDELGKAAFPILLPVGITGLGWYLYLQKDHQQSYEKLKKPSWTISSTKALLPLDLIAVAPVGYAAHLICKSVQGNDRTIALSLYGASLLSLVAGFSAFVKTTDMKCWLSVQTLAATLFGATAFAFYKIDRTSGLLLVPVTAWLTYGSIGMAATIRANPNPK